MLHIYALANTKGGVGKSTLAANLAVVAATTRHQVLLVDADPQASGLQFLNARDDTRPHFAGIQLSQPILHKQLPVLSAPYDYVFIDVGGSRLHADGTAYPSHSRPQREGARVLEATKDRQVLSLERACKPQPRHRQQSTEVAHQKTKAVFITVWHRRSRNVAEPRPERLNRPNQA